MPRKLFFTLLFLQVSLSLLQAQIVWSDPQFPTPSQPVTIYFDATKGTAGLADCNCDVYVHTGLITSVSQSGSDWKHVVTSWGVANAAWKMTPVPGQANVYSYLIQPSIKSYYNVTNQNEVIQKMAFVFRNANGSKEGKDTGGSDIFVNVYPDNLDLTTAFLAPTSHSLLTQLGAKISVVATASQTANLSLFDNGNLLYSTNGTSLSFEIVVASGGTHIVEFKADNGSQVSTRSFTYAVPNANVMEPLPAGVEHGINYLSDSEILLALRAPYKSNVFLLGDFNNWQFDNDYQLKRTPDGQSWWIQIGGLTPGKQYAFQYVVDGSIRIGDPYSTLILDPANDGFIPAVTFPNIPPYPTGKTTGIASIAHPAAPPFNWQTTGYQPLPQEKLVIYEMLLRDYLHRHDFQTLKDTLDYLHRLGVNAVELMPINEFDGNISWGYNPTYHHALDKYYGTPDAFKAFVDECHARGIAVILDVVFNHAHERNPLAMLYWDAVNFKPSANNPWLNVNPTHDFNVFFDFNHESFATKEYVKKTLKHWLTEFRVDGFRFDLSKGLTQNVNGPFHAGNYDASRIAILKDYANAVWQSNPNAYVILEHFTDNSEEKELSDYGMMLWAGFPIHNQYLEAAMAYSSNLTGVSHKSKGWNDPHLVAYMESHDEERMMYKNLQFGNSSGNYNVKSLPTALDRVELASAFFYTVPGPKMLWQFGELGYDFPINYCVNGTINNNCRLDPKPIRWDYMKDKNRLDVYNVVRSLLYLRNNYEVFHTNDFQLNVAQGAWKTINLNHPQLNVTVVGNFNVLQDDPNPGFQHTGWWYEFFSGDSLNVTDVNAPLIMQPGEYRLYTDVKVAKPPVFTETEYPIANSTPWAVFPNPNTGNFYLQFSLENSSRVQADLFNSKGQKVAVLIDENRQAGVHAVEVSHRLSPGVYFMRIGVDGKFEHKKVVIL
jgi:1,4-alpha-glucan branching enzyme